MGGGELHGVAAERGDPAPGVDEDRHAAAVGQGREALHRPAP
jgi:hypothetical protein